jgi:hypothetical protein
MANKQGQVNKAKIDPNDPYIDILPKKRRDTAKKLFDAASVSKVDFTKQLPTVEMANELSPIIDSIWDKSFMSPAKVGPTTDTLVDSGVKITYKDPLHKKSVDADMLAYVSRINRGNYEIFINGLTEEEAFDSMDLHEKGHVLFNHTEGLQLYLKTFENEIARIWDEKIAKHFTEDVLKSVKKSKVIEFLYSQFSNIAQDMEINSKLFENEWMDAKKLLARSMLVMLHKRLISQFDDLSGLIHDDKARQIGTKQNQLLASKFKAILNNIKSRIDGDIDDFQFCYPTQRGWPEKLDWMTYMVLLVKDADDVMEFIKNAINAKFAQGQGQGGGKPISKDVLDQYFESKDKQEEAADDGSGDDESLDGEGEEAGSHDRSPGGEGRGKGSNVVESQIQILETFDAFTKFLAKECLGKKNRRLHSDQLYYENRGKIAHGDALMPRRHMIEKWMPTEIYIVVDVSGSVATDYVDRIIESIISTNSGIEPKKSHIMFCDTSVQKDITVDKLKEGGKTFSGGGTEIANGIKYAAKYMKKKTDKLFVISDFEDDLSEWVDAAKKIPGKKYAIGYNVHNADKIDTSYVMRAYYNNNKGAEAFVKTFNVMIISEKM